MKHPAARQAWILEYLRHRSRPEVLHNVNVLDAYFVDAFIDFSGAPFRCKVIGANGCPALGRDLLALHKAGKLQRWPAGIGGGLSGMGFPRWVWDYKLKELPK